MRLASVHASSMPKPRAPTFAHPLNGRSMEECEAVCSRVGIMAAGRLRALGTVQHLKQKHGRGWVHSEGCRYDHVLSGWTTMCEARRLCRVLRLPAWHLPPMGPRFIAAELHPR